MRRLRLSAETLNNEFVKRIQQVAGQGVYACYQCGKCTAGCPMAAEMDLTPNQVMRYAQFGLGEKLRGCRTVWLCASCFTCSARCPKGVKIAEVMEAIRVVLIRNERGGPGPQAVKINEDGLPPIAIISALRKLTF
ncbi:MAG: 4Fe-4S dicluster domain-containing protein [Pseudomonadota bacterium]